MNALKKNIQPLIVAALAMICGVAQATTPELHGEGARNDVVVPVALLDGTTLVYTLVDGQSFEISFQKGEIATSPFA